MNTTRITTLLLALLLTLPLITSAEPTPTPAQPEASKEYLVGVGDVLDINILRPEAMLVPVTVAPDGAITFPYIGAVKAKDMTLAQIQDDVQTRLGNGFMKYPVVAVSLRESRSKKFFVYGEVMRPGVYMLEDNTTVLKAISTAGGFTKFGSSSRVKVLRLKKDKPGYNVIKININAVMNGSSDADIIIETGDTIVVSKGMF